MATQRVIVGDCRDVLPTLPEKSVHVVCTSPPYFGLRSYLPLDHPEKHREIGTEKIPDCLGWATGQPCGECYVCALVAVFREVRRVLRDDGTLWVVIGDSYNNNSHGPNPGQPHNGFAAYVKGTGRGRCKTLKPKDLMMVPARLALALQANGWWLRMENVWAKRSCMPESVTDRTTRSHEMVYVFSKRERYYYDSVAVAEVAVRGAAGSTFTEGKTGVNGQGRVSQRERADSGSRNLRSVWSLSPEPFAEAHFATFPTEIPRRAILAGTSERGCCPACGSGWVRAVERALTGVDDKRPDRGVPGRTGLGHSRMRAGDPDARTLDWRPACSCPPADPVPAVVLDPFSGSGRTGLAADRLGRDSVLIELNPAYAKLSRDQIVNDAPLFAAVTLEPTGD